MIGKTIEISVIEYRDLLKKAQIYDMKKAEISKSDFVSNTDKLLFAVEEGEDDDW